LPPAGSIAGAAGRAGRTGAGGVSARGGGGTASIDVPLAESGGDDDRVVHIQTLPVPEGADFLQPPPGSAGRAVFAADDPRVVPPTLLRPHLPSEPGPWLTPGTIGTFDLLVRPDGGVEQVRLQSPTNRFQERMLLSAAKAWRFRPATRNGVPVWCHVRVRVTI
jgi:hypothetical protein